MNRMLSSSQSACLNPVTNSLSSKLKEAAKTAFWMRLRAFANQGTMKFKAPRNHVVTSCSSFRKDAR